MKKLLTVAIAAAVVVSFTAEAHSVGAFLSYWNGKDTDNGYGFGVNHQIKIVPIVHGDIRASWLSFNESEGSDLNLYPLEGLVRVKLGMFYVGAGVGYYIFSGKDVDWDNSWGGFGVGGIEFTILKIGAFGELKYTAVDSRVEDSFDVDGSGIGINAGVIFNWF